MNKEALNEIIQCKNETSSFLVNLKNIDSNSDVMAVLKAMVVKQNQCLEAIDKMGYVESKHLGNALDKTYNRIIAEKNALLSLIESFDGKKTINKDNQTESLVFNFILNDIVRNHEITAWNVVESQQNELNGTKSQGSFDLLWIVLGFLIVIFGLRFLRLNIFNKKNKTEDK